jgi:hypothetical protein
MARQLSERLRQQTDDPACGRRDSSFGVRVDVVASNGTIAANPLNGGGQRIDSAQPP